MSSPRGLLASLGVAAFAWAAGIAVEVFVYGHIWRRWGGGAEWLPDWTYTPMILAVLFGPQAVFSALAVWLVQQGYALRADVMPLWAYILGVAMTIVALALGPLFAFNTYGT